MHNFRMLQERGFVKGTSLMMTHKELLGNRNSVDFHNALTDCLATKELDEWFEKNVKVEVSK